MPGARDDRRDFWRPLQPLAPHPIENGESTFPRRSVVGKFLLVKITGELALARGESEAPAHQAGTGEDWASARATAVTYRSHVDRSARSVLRPFTASV